MVRRVVSDPQAQHPQAGASERDALRALLEATTLPAIWFDPNGRLGVRNAAAVRALGGAPFPSAPGPSEASKGAVSELEQLFERDPMGGRGNAAELFRAVWPSASAGLRFRRVAWGGGVVFLATSGDSAVPATSPHGRGRRGAGGDEALEAMASLAGGVAHDLNNHLTAIFASLQQVRGALDPQGEDAAGEAHCALTEVEAAAERVRRLSHQLVAFSRCQIDCPRPMDFDAAVQSARSSLERGLQASLVLEPRANGAMVLVDPGPFERLLQIAGRLLRGARSYHSTTSVRESIPSVHVQVEPCCRLHLRAAEGDAPEADSAFVREELEELARRVGADVELDADGHGLELSFPTYSESPSEEAPAEDDKPRELLVVEDDRPVREVLCRILSGAGYVVHAAGNAMEALALEPGLTLDLLVTDVHMPGQNGFELYRRLCSRRGAIRVLFVSGLVEDEAVRGHLERHRLEFLPKPFSASDLLERVARALVRPAPRVRRLLVVDDEPETLATIERLLEGTDYECRLVKTVEDALAVLEAGGADVVLSDMVMPDRDGLELLREIDRRRIDCRFVAMSGHMTRRAVLAAAEELGAACALHKPFGRDELLAALEMAS